MNVNSNFNNSNTVNDVKNRCSTTDDNLVIIDEDEDF